MADLGRFPGWGARKGREWRKISDLNEPKDSPWQMMYDLLRTEHSPVLCRTVCVSTLSRYFRAGWLKAGPFIPAGQLHSGLTWKSKYGKGWSHWERTAFHHLSPCQAFSPASTHTYTVSSISPGTKGHSLAQFSLFSCSQMHELTQGNQRHREISEASRYVCTEKANWERTHLSKCCDFYMVKPKCK